MTTSASGYSPDVTGFEPVVEEVRSEVFRIAVPLPLPELHTVNCYAFVGREGVTIIDPGWASPDADAALTNGLRELGLTVGDVERTLVTHHHWDHYTQAIAWTRAYGIPVHLGRGERHSIAAWYDLDGAYPVQAELLRRAGAEPLAVEIGELRFEDHELTMPFEEPTHWLDGGERWSVGASTLEAVSTPGHTRGHMVFADVDNDLLVTGDHVLPRITPSIAYERQPDPLSLRSYLASLQLLMDRPDARQLPAHGQVQDSTHERVRELLDHHAARLDLVGGLVADGYGNAYAVASEMRWTRHQRSLDDLPALHAMTAVMEAAAHLQLLEHQGELTVLDADGVDQYAVS